MTTAVLAAQFYTVRDFTKTAADLTRHPAQSARDYRLRRYKFPRILDRSPIPKSKRWLMIWG